MVHDDEHKEGGEVSADAVDEMLDADAEDGEDLDLEGAEKEATDEFGGDVDEVKSPRDWE
jgi:hypothetical protein